MAFSTQISNTKEVFKLSRLSLALGAILVLTFTVTSMLLFYWIFELSLLPIFLMILGWGYQPERLNAGIQIFLYTVVASLPLLMSILACSGLFRADLLDWSSAHSSGQTSIITRVFPLLLAIGILVKIPIYGIHLWLPKAHVEAPVSGSIALAAILLKLGAYGLVRVSPLIPFSFFTLIVIRVRLWGGVRIGLLCLRQTDAKVLIAYSSVAHMSLLISAAMTHNRLGAMAVLMMAVAHGVVSSGIFIAANTLYLNFNSRNILLAKTLIARLPLFSLWWFILCACNMGAPPSFNLLREIFCFLRIGSHNLTSYLFLGLAAILAVAYTLLLYSRTQHGKPTSGVSCGAPLSPRDFILLITHSFCAGILVVSPALVYSFYPNIRLRVNAARYTRFCHHAFGWRRC